MKAYLSVPIIANRSVSTARLMAGAIKAAGHELISPWVLTDLETRPSESINIFSRDRAAVEECDILVAEVSRPSTGVGMEVMTAYQAGKRIILVAETGSKITRMLTDMKEAEWVYFADELSLLENLQTKLSEEPGSNSPSRLGN
jgi:nucleoside 2-deoxyribosyltransferase